MNMTRRLKVLETASPAALSPHAKAWLGQPLSPAEQAAVDADPHPDLGPIDTSGSSERLRVWLGLD